MQSVMAERTFQPASRPRPNNDLTRLATPVLDIIMRIRAGLITPSGDMRREIDGLLKQMEQRGDALGRHPRTVEAIKFALTAFVDETVLTADFPLRDAWEKYPLQLEYFKEHLAGVTFFDRLDEMLKNPTADPDVVEVYYLCLLLGYEGKHKKYYLEQLQKIIETVAAYLRSAGRLQTVPLSPHWRVVDQPVLSPNRWLPRWARLTLAGAFAGVILIYVMMKFFLGGELKAAIEQLLR